ncbi:MAG: TetR/AcrR family transcriptional regulator [Erysipelotrichaceae bacterium]|nr:TetR/AcrR family transcriptional regulator [Erysipelotrichaceae bacterium]
MKQRESITQHTRQNIIDAFWSLYCEKTIDKITVKEITQKAGYNRSTFYEYFHDAYDVLDKLEETLIPNLSELPPITVLSKDFGLPTDLFMDLFEHNKKYYAVLLSENGDPAFTSRLKKVIKPLLMSAFTGSTKPINHSLDYTLEYTLSAMIGILSYWISSPKPLPNDELYALVHKLMQEGSLKILQENHAV